MLQILRGASQFAPSLQQSARSPASGQRWNVPPHTDNPHRYFSIWCQALWGCVGPSVGTLPGLPPKETDSCERKHDTERFSVGLS